VVQKKEVQKKKKTKRGRAVQKGLPRRTPDSQEARTEKKKRQLGGKDGAVEALKLPLLERKKKSFSAKQS